MKRFALLALSGTLVLAACAPQTPEARTGTCIVGAAGGAALGTVLGNKVGQGTGRDVATLAGGVAGAVAGSNVACQ